ncbi:hypothetical protein HanRHA438_Chr06g0272301 [Helianthus annuus]|uniref:Uncharacterized protein n=1 Tax=Helianthus annuus TaxID=4232 RepID=A0A251UNT8_HELAN|nr:hypothetical protein HanXRQr2_Chr06g0263051 [Helianthus annuus]KAJ0560824.1 hypothetical protein HanHA300_Chr06g0215761 [Helianthus annuus]KAJ0567262.1 hypothetical protein HanIR_Chr06g0282811 [Helianthus annuus]KAJ0573861.1 hypothetical protein HanHA89_Chr06g0231541 [Helianthus annuus]KAJ0738197.1 hypothetical protein HanLR1_Chr06g0215481 [Helianthus annuus]
MICLHSIEFVLLARIDWLYMHCILSTCDVIYKTYVTNDICTVYALLHNTYSTTS